MVTGQGCTKLFEVYTDGDNVWAMNDGELVARADITQDIDGSEVALGVALQNLAQQASREIPIKTVFG